MYETYGFSSNWYDAKQLKGNIMALQLIVSALKIQPCRPTFLDARNAILSADQTNYGGANKCLIWRAFAKRGMGINASSAGYVENFELPAGC
jgi:extracellular elastinolytic metalloproteinase